MNGILYASVMQLQRARIAAAIEEMDLATEAFKKAQRERAAIFRAYRGIPEAVRNQHRPGFDYSGANTTSPAALRKQANGSEQWALVYQEQPDERNYHLLHLPSGKPAMYFHHHVTFGPEVRRWRTAKEAYSWLDRAVASNFSGLDRAL